MDSQILNCLGPNAWNGAIVGRGAITPATLAQVPALNQLGFAQPVLQHAFLSAPGPPALHRGLIP